MPDMTLIDLSKYRLAKAAETLETAKRDMHAEDYASANNRAYYCIFHAMRAVLALQDMDFKKHSAVIAAFNRDFIHTGSFDRSFGTVINNASLIRNHSDYDDFFVISKAEVLEQIENAEFFLAGVKSFLEGR